MKKSIKTSFIFLLAAIVVLSAFTIKTAINWQIKDGYSVRFSGTAVEGVFEKMSGEIAFDANNLASSKLSVNLDVASISTGNWLKNRHAKGENWFDAEKFPTINFTSSSFSKSANGFVVNGFLVMHGVKKPVSIPFTFTNDTFKGSFSVNRIDYGVGTMEGMSKKVSNAIKLDISVPVAKK